MFAERDGLRTFLLLRPVIVPARSVAVGQLDIVTPARRDALSRVRTSLGSAIRATTSDLDVNIIHLRYPGHSADGIIPTPRR